MVTGCYLQHPTHIRTRRLCRRINFVHNGLTNPCSALKIRKVNTKRRRGRVEGKRFREPPDGARRQRPALNWPPSSLCQSSASSEGREVPLQTETSARSAGLSAPAVKQSGTAEDSLSSLKTETEGFFMRRGGVPPGSSFPGKVFPERSFPVA